MFPTRKMSNADVDSVPSATLTPLPREFYIRPAVQVARDLLGALLVRRIQGMILSGVITETEAYQGEEDLGCHARVGRTPRTMVMYGPAGHAYIYFTYGMHWLLNAVTGQEGEPAAVLIRALLPISGLEWMEQFRPRPVKRSSANLAAGWTDGPAKICQALRLGREQNTADLCDPGSELFLQAGWSIPDDQIGTSARVGLFSVPEPWKSIPWRFQVVPSWFSNFSSASPPSFLNFD